MNDDKPLDMLQIKIDRARDALPKATRKAIDSVDWRAFILSMREKKGYSFEQLEDLELETELLLCGLLPTGDYPKELEERMKLPRPQIDLLVNEMNEFVFKKIKDELIRNTEREEVFVKKETPPINSNVIATDKHVISPNIIRTNKPVKVIPKTETTPVLSKETNLEVMPEELSVPVKKISEINNKTEVINKNEMGVLSKTGIEIIPEEKPDSLFSQKLSGSFKMPAITTEYSSSEHEKDKVTPIPSDKIRNSKDPYREIPE